MVITTYFRSKNCLLQILFLTSKRMIASGEMENILERYDESVRELVLRVNQEFDEYLMKPKTFPDFEQEFELFRLNHSCSEDFLTYLNERINIARWTKIAMEKRLIRKSFEELQIQHDPEKSETSGSLLMFNELLEFIGPSNSGNISPHSKVLNDTIDFNSTDTKDSLLSGSILANDHNITAATGRMCWFCEVYESNKTLVFTSLFHGKTNAAAKIYAISGVMVCSAMFVDTFENIYFFLRSLNQVTNW